MEKKSIWKSILWASVIVQIAMSTATNVTEPPAPTQTQVPEESLSSYAWSSWSRWSKCSRTCGGGVSMQERECLPRSKLSPLGTLPPPIVTVRVTRETHDQDCIGVARRYHQCNIQPCKGNSRGLRAEQCASYDRRPFRGHFYTWVPYVDGNSPCTLNCRPLGQHFYATLALVADGTPCTKPGLRAICVQGQCKVVGRETVLAGGTEDLKCGGRLVSGLFSRPRLHLGYSYITTVPRGACRLNVSEIVASDNYIALKITNGSYIMNGEFAVSLPGSYEAVGSQFIYSRVAGLDQIVALGPIHHSVDIMILYTKPTPNIKYEYFTESLGSENDEELPLADLASPKTIKHMRSRHSFDNHPPIISTPKYLDLNTIEDEFYDVQDHTVGGRHFTWKILSYSQCTRTCGGGFQFGKYKCVETASNSRDKEVSAVHCTGALPASQRRRCGSVPCPPRWRAAAWTACPECGPATRTRIVGCVQDNARGITKISDFKCKSTKPPTEDKCYIPNCDDISSAEVRRIEPKRPKPRQDIDEFRAGPIYSVSVNSTDDSLGPEYSFSAAVGWLYTDWSECVGWCVGSGVQTRGVRCADPSGCAPMKDPERSRSCTPKAACQTHGGEWFVGEWSKCSSKCNGQQVRGVLCIGGSGRHLKESACSTPRPERARNCGTDCAPEWYFSDWGKCTGNCSQNMQRRSVMCIRGDSGAGVGDADCTSPRPEDQKTCDLDCPSSTLPPYIPIESQKSSDYDTIVAIVSRDEEQRDETHKEEINTSKSSACADKLPNCALAVQARLCHYKFYVENCCESCRGR